MRSIGEIISELNTFLSENQGIFHIFDQIQVGTPPEIPTKAAEIPGHLKKIIKKICLKKSGISGLSLLVPDPEELPGVGEPMAGHNILVVADGVHL